MSQAPSSPRRAGWLIYALVVLLTAGATFGVVALLLSIRQRKADEAYQDWVRQMRDRAFVENRYDER